LNPRLPGFFYGSSLPGAGRTQYQGDISPRLDRKRASQKKMKISFLLSLTKGAPTWPF